MPFKLRGGLAKKFLKKFLKWLREQANNDAIATFLRGFNSVLVLRSGTILRGKVQSN